MEILSAMIQLLGGLAVFLRHRLAVRVSSRGGAGPERECGPQEGPEQRPARGPLPSTASNTQVRMEHGVFLAWTLSTQMLQAGLRAHSFSKRSQELNKATRGLRTKAEGRSPIIRK